jgi:hypothetical protein
VYLLSIASLYTLPTFFLFRRTALTIWLTGHLPSDAEGCHRLA